MLAGIAVVGALVYFHRAGRGPLAGSPPRQSLPGRSDRAAPHAIQTDLTFTNSRIPYSESSRP